MARYPTGKRNGRPNYLSRYERDLAIMTAWLALNLECDDMSQMFKRGEICNLFDINESNLDAIITRCTKLLKKGKIAFDAETKQFIFNEHKSEKSALTVLREVRISHYFYGGGFSRKAL